MLRKSHHFIANFNAGDTGSKKPSLFSASCYVDILVQIFNNSVVISASTVYKAPFVLNKSVGHRAAQNRDE